MNTAQPLDAYNGPVDGFGVLCPQSGPAFTCHADPGIDWTCPECGAVLLQAVHPGQFLNVLVRCYECPGVGSTSRREPGQPLAGKPILFAAGQYRLDSTVSATEPAMAVGPQAIEGYALETGSPTFGAAEEPREAVELTGDGMRALANEMASLLGDRFEKLRKSDERGLRSQTPPARRHRLVELIAYAESAGATLDAQVGDEEVVIDANLLAELLLTRALFHRWRHHPAYPELVVALANDTEGQHAVMLLALASYLVDAGNGVGIVFASTDSGRIADLWTEPRLLERLDLEIKTPLALRGPRKAPLDLEEATKIVLGQLDGAAATSGGQLGAESGILAIGAYHLHHGDLQILQEAVEQILAAQKDRKKHLAAVTITAMSYEQSVKRDESGALLTTSLTPTLETEVIRHPGYAGNLSIERTASELEIKDFPKISTASPAKRARKSNKAKKRKAQRQARRRGRRR